MLLRRLTAVHRAQYGAFGDFDQWAEHTGDDSWAWKNFGKYVSLSLSSMITALWSTRHFILRPYDLPLMTRVEPLTPHSIAPGVVRSARSLGRLQSPILVIAMTNLLLSTPVSITSHD